MVSDVQQVDITVLNDWYAGIGLNALECSPVTERLTLQRAQSIEMV